jgi:hypothetical protein
MTIETLVGLRCHKASRCDQIRAIQVAIRRTIAALKLGFRLDGNLSCIRLGAPGDSAVELWRHTCFELFIALEGQTAYYEFNFAPSRAWRAYAFRAYRDPYPASFQNQLRPPSVDVKVTNERLELTARVSLNGQMAKCWDPPLRPSHSPLCLGISAVIEHRDGALSYWALRHPADKPDFHHADGFSLRLEPPILDKGVG